MNQSPFRSLRLAAAAGLGLVYVLGSPLVIAAGFPLDEARGGIPTLAPLLEKATPAIVNIATSTTVRATQNPLAQDPFFRQFFGNQDQPATRQVQAAGSGVIVDAAKGYIVTNNHVIAGADKITVTLKDGRQLEAKLVGTDDQTDIALVQVQDRIGLTAIALGDSAGLKVGDFVIAVGNPFGLGQTVTSGIISALGRGGLNIEGYEDFIQTDASINPGNSGGALLDLRGQVIGINTAIIGPAGGNVGIGFAVPIAMVKSVVDQLAEFGQVKRGRLGVEIADATPEVTKAMGLSVTQGAVITRVEADSPADKAGIKAGDVITRFQGADVRDSRDLRNRVGLVRLGQAVNLTFVRGAKATDARLQLAEIHQAAATPPGPQGRGGPPAPAPATAGIPAMAGSVLSDVDPARPAQGQKQGVVVTSVDANSAAYRNGIRAGDVIVGINNRSVSTVSEFQKAAGQISGTMALAVVRDGRNQIVLVR